MFRGLTWNEPQWSDQRHLPTEVWVEIFGHLPAKEQLPVRLVCRRFRDIVDGWTLLSRLSTVTFPIGIELDGDYEPAFLLPSREARFNKAKLFALAAWWSPFAANLRELQLCSSTVLFPTFLEMLRQMPNLRRLRLDKVDFAAVSDSTADFRLDRMEDLTISSISKELSEAYARVLPGLKTLTLSWYHADIDEYQWLSNFVQAVQETLESFGPCHDMLLLSEISKIPKLKLKALSCDLDWYRPIDLIENCRLQPSIEDFNLKNTRVSNTTLFQMGKILKNLKRIKFKIARRKTSTSITFLQTMSRIEYLELKGSNKLPQTVSFAKCRSPNLKRLSLENIHQTRTSWSFLKASPNLREISLENCLFDSWCDFSEPIEGLNQLQHLTLTNVQMQSHPEYLFLEPWRNMKTLTITDCNFSEQMLFELGYACPQLRELHLRNLRSLQDRLVLWLCRKLPYLTDLSVQQCPSATTVTVSGAMFRCYALVKEEIKAAATAMNAWIDFN